MALVTFGGAYAVLSYVAQYAGETAGWLTPDQMLDGLGLAETTPGPLIMVLQFVGFLAGYGNPGELSPMTAATLGALLATWVTFVPSFVLVFLGAPFVEAIRRQRILAAALGTITAAVVGVVLNLSIWFALHVLFDEVRVETSGPLNVSVPVLASVDWAALALMAFAALLLFRLGAGLLATIGATALAGVVFSIWSVYPDAATSEACSSAVGDARSPAIGAERCSAASPRGFCRGPIQDTPESLSPMAGAPIRSIAGVRVRQLHRSGRSPDCACRFRHRRRRPC
jgi:chromate transport protein ChrA